MTYARRAVLPQQLAGPAFPQNPAHMVGLTGFEPATPCPPDRCATKLRYSP